MIKRAWLATAVFVMAAFGVSIADWYEDFSSLDESNYELAGNCDLCGCWLADDGEFLVTPAEGSRYGRLVYLQQHNLGVFDARFDFMLDGSADGIVFVWTNDPWAGHTTGGGGELNWMGGVGYGVEVDLCVNYEDPVTETPHIALMKDGCYSGNVLGWSYQPSVSNGLWHSLRVINVYGNILVLYDDALVLDVSLGEYSEEVGYFRVSGSTGAAYAEQRVDNIEVQATSTAASITTWSCFKSIY